MLKYVYKVIILMAVFCAAVFIIGKNMKEVQVDLNTTVKMKNASFPLLYLETGGYNINLLHGYTGDISANSFRESITPVNKGKTLTVQMTENESVIKKLKYEFREVKDNKLLDTGAVSALDVTKTGKKTDIKLKYDPEVGKEYSLKLTVITNASKKIHYFTRIKYYEEDYFLKEKMNFINSFHKSTLDKVKAQSLLGYIEPDNTEDNSSFSQVTIHSSLDMISWGKMKPKVVSVITPTIKELNIETASVLLSYYVSAKTDSGEELYKVKEFYRVRFTLNRIYLLKFNRTMEAVFDINKASVNESRFKIGISSERNLNIITNTDNSRMCFVRQGALWYYNMEKNKAVRVFSFLKGRNDLIRGGYDQHQVRVLNMDEEGNIDFIVYGYMNSGDYEGKVAIILYKFYAGENRIKEQVYIPLDITYQMLKEDLNDFCYVNRKGVFYFILDNVIYSYNIIARRVTIVADGIKDGNVYTLKESNAIAWLDSSNIKKAKKISVLDLESEDKKIISAPAGNNIRILGSIDSDVIYGYVNSEDIVETKEGTEIAPVYKLEIADSHGNVLKTYKKNNVYISDVNVKDNIISLNRVKKQNSGGRINYVAVDSDSILNNISYNTQTFNVTTSVPELTRTELYISFPPGVLLKNIPSMKESVNTIITEDTTLRLKEPKTVSQKYYVDAGGEVIKAFNRPKDAILLADEEMGVVLDHRSRLVWERGNRFVSNSISDINLIPTGNGVDSTGACVSMLLKQNQITVSPQELTASGKSISSLLKQHLELPLNLTGCTLDEVLYYVSNQRPVIAMKNKNNAVLITGYSDYYVTITDPGTKNTKQMTITSAEAMFKNAGNIFISYLN